MTQQLLLNLSQDNRPDRTALMAWIDERQRIFEKMTEIEAHKFVLDEVIANFNVGRSPQAEVEYWQGRLTTACT